MGRSPHGFLALLTVPFNVPLCFCVLGGKWEGSGCVLGLLVPVTVILTLTFLEGGVNVANVGGGRRGGRVLFVFVVIMCLNIFANLHA